MRVSGTHFRKENYICRLNSILRLYFYMIYIYIQHTYIIYTKCVQSYNKNCWAMMFCHSQQKIYKFIPPGQ
jgi:hypothetical protein